MLRGEDIVLLLKLVDAPADWTVRSLESETTIPRSVVQRAIKRLAEARLDDQRGRAWRSSRAGLVAAGVDPMIVRFGAGHGLTTTSRSGAGSRTRRRPSTDSGLAGRGSGLRTGR